MAQKLARLTGLSAEYIERANLRVDPGRFRKELLRDKRLVVGRLDSRFTSIDGDAAGEQRGVRSVEHRAAGRVHRAVPGLREERAEVGERICTTRLGQRLPVELDDPEPLHGHDRAAALDDGAATRS